MFQINQKLTNPIKNIRTSNLFVHLEALMSNKEDNLPQGVWVKKHTQNWHEIINICTEILTKHSKDLQVMAWLLEANLHIKKNMYTSLNMFEYMIDNHWENQDIAYKIMFNLNKSLLKSLPMQLFIYDNYTLHDFQNGKPIPNDPTHNIDYFSKDLSMETNGTTNPINQNWLTFSQKFIEICTKCEEKLKNGVFQKTKSILNSFIEQISNNSNNKEQEIKQPDSGTIKSRTHAYKLIREIMQFLKKNDPHSATPYLLQKACEWENKSFAEILDEFNDPIIIQKIFQQNKQQP